MSSSDHRDLQSGQVQAFASKLRDLHTRAGRPSMRAMAVELGNVSHTTVADALNGRRLPSWSVVRSIVKLLGGDEELWREDWIAASSKPTDPNIETSVDQEFLTRYRRLVVEYHGKLELPDFERRRRVPIADLYVPLRIRPARSDAIDDLDTRQLDDLVDHTVLLGNPGGGKTTVCNELMFRHAVNPERVTPFLVTLRDFVVEALPTRSVIGHIETRLDTFYQCPPPSGLVERLISEGNALVLFDGLDELVDVAKRTEATSIVELFCAEFPQARVLVTSRLAGYAESQLDPHLFTTYVLAGFSQSQITEYVRKWFTRESSLTAVDARRHIMTFMEESAYGADLLANPLVLALMCVFYRGQGDMPSSRPELYERSVRLLLETWDARRRIHVDLRARHLVEPALRYIAFWILNRSDSKIAVPMRELVTELSDFLHQRMFGDRDEATHAARELVDFLRGRAWMLTSVGTTPQGEELYGFTHRMFLEYFAAAQLAVTAETPEDLAHIITPHLARGEWEMVSQIALQIYDRNFERGAERAIETLLNEYDKSTASERKILLRFLKDCAEFLLLSPKLTRRLSAYSTSS